MKDRIRAWAGNPGWTEIAIGCVVAWIIVVVLSQLLLRDDRIDATDLIVWGTATVIGTLLAIRLVVVARRSLRR
jgi:uncharacterized protein YybS (DUF2232 family)